ncbi:MAG: hypothetical protein LBK62_04300 [Treponema sp.]|jgi:hypothetical protein|nr:hypothetical protein [Treponema sp.]
MKEKVTVKRRGNLFLYIFIDPNLIIAHFITAGRLSLPVKQQEGRCYE